MSSHLINADIFILVFSITVTEMIRLSASRARYYHDIFVFMHGCRWHWGTVGRWSLDLTGGPPNFASLCPGLAWPSRVQVMFSLIHVFCLHQQRNKLEEYFTENTHTVSIQKAMMAILNFNQGQLNLIHCNI